MSERGSDPETKHKPGLDAALERAGERLAQLHREIESAAGLLEDLTSTPEPDVPGCFVPPLKGRSLNSLAF
jgi:hypothetical protein